MNLYRKSLFMNKKNICMLVICIMTLLYFSFGVSYADEIAMQNSLAQSHSISSILQGGNHNDSLVENNNKSMEYCERHNSIPFFKMHVRRMSNKETLFRVILLLLIFVLLVSFLFIAFQKNVRFIVYHIIQFLHRSDGKKRMSY